MKYDVKIYLNGSKIILKKRNICEYILKDSVLDHGIIIDKKQFTNILIKILHSNKISTLFPLNNLLVIYNFKISINDLNIIKDVFTNFNFKMVKYKKDISLISLSKNTIYLLNNNNNNILLLYKDKFNTVKHLCLDCNNLSTFEIKYLILNRIKNKNIYVIDSNNKLERIINKITTRYYIYNDKNFIINNIN